MLRGKKTFGSVSSNALFAHKVSPVRTPGREERGGDGPGGKRARSACPGRTPSLRSPARGQGRLRAASAVHHLSPGKEGKGQPS